ncbi:MAG: hypothetical protein U9R07_11840 [Pseudomonadota bacterium]|nr:hypothetical protein [Pseudomonadota bacterium]
MARLAPPPAIELLPIDEFAMNGRFQLVLRDAEFAVARWADGAWWFSSGQQLDFMPSEYHPVQERAHG